MTPSKTHNPDQTSALYIGVVRHRRFAPIEHAFEMPVFMVYLDLDELETGRVLPETVLFSCDHAAPARFAREDYFGPADLPLSTAVRDRIQAVTGRRPAGPIRLLTNLRYLGYCFNPVSFYYCFEEHAPRLSVILAEITNTPWNQRHTYLLDCGSIPTPGNRAGSPAPTLDRFSFPKVFHVSPFMPMDLEYDWAFTTPADRLFVHMNLRSQSEPEMLGVFNGQTPAASKPSSRSKAFDATLDLTRSLLTPASLLNAMIRFPLMTARVMARIHWEALSLWYKGVPVAPHPQRSGLPHPIRDLGAIQAAESQPSISPQANTD